MEYSESRELRLSRVERAVVTSSRIVINAAQAIRVVKPRGD